MSNDPKSVFGLSLFGAVKEKSADDSTTPKSIYILCVF